ncbi:hypothetical protein F5Y19DRAFT_378637 [Xylariaceae sp. FL1651]|nr:hypothetical protein F5Y19DRAFT_378637 [Xylariaceae sp. FL1651]
MQRIPAYNHRVDTHLRPISNHTCLQVGPGPLNPLRVGWELSAEAPSSPEFVAWETSLSSSAQTVSSSLLPPPRSTRAETPSSPQSSHPSHSSISVTARLERQPLSQFSPSQTTAPSRQTPQPPAPRTPSTGEPLRGSSPLRPLPWGSPPRILHHGQSLPDTMPRSPGNRQMMSHRQAEYSTRSLLRDRPVIVLLEPGARGYVCNRADILEHLPNTRHTPFGRTFQPRIARQHQSQSTLDALHALFHGFERYRATGTPYYLFESARDWLYHEPTLGFQGCFNFFIGVCTALDSELGLGCSDELLQQIDEFAVDLMYSHEIGFFAGNRRILDFFIAYSKVFQPTTQRHLDTLRELYNLIPGQLRARLVVHLTAMLDAMPQRSNANAMFRTMRDLGMA